MPDALDGDFSRSRAVLVGTWDYRHLSPVPAAEHSLYRMRDLLMSPLCGSWPEDRVRVIANPRTPTGVLEELVTWFRDVDDVAMFYYVGHGLCDDRAELCLALVDTNADPHRRGFTSLRYHQVRDAFRAGYATTKFAILDCCNAGLAAYPNTLGPQTLEPPPARGFSLMMASGELTSARFESAAESSRPQTYFTKYLADTVERGIPGGPEGLALGPIFDRVAAAMKRDGRPEPHHSIGDHAGHFVFARNAALPGSDSGSGSGLRPGSDSALPALPDAVGPPSPGPVARPRLYQRRAVLATLATGAIGAGSWLLADLPSGKPPTHPDTAPTTGQSTGATPTPGTTRGITAATALGGPITLDDAVVFSVAFSTDSRTLAGGTDHNDVELWNVAAPTRPTPLGQPLTGPANSVLAVAFSPDRRTLAGGSYDATVRLWDVSGSASPRSLGPPLPAGAVKGVTSVAFSPDGHTLAAGGYDHSVRLWDVSDPAHPVLLGQPLTGHADTVTSVAFSPDGGTLASASHDDTVRLWDVADPAHAGPLGQPLVGHDATVNCVVFDRARRILASAGDDKTVRLWDVSDPAHAGPLGRPLTGHTKAVESVAAYPFGNTLASGGDDATVRLWNVADPTRPEAIGEPLLGHRAAVGSVAFSPDGNTLASGSSDSTIRLWRLS